MGSTSLWDVKDTCHADRLGQDLIPTGRVYEPRRSPYIEQFRIVVLVLVELVVVLTIHDRFMRVGAARRRHVAREQVVRDLVQVLPHAEIPTLQGLLTLLA